MCISIKYDVYNSISYNTGLQSFLCISLPILFFLSSLGLVPRSGGQHGSRTVRLADGMLSGWELSPSMRGCMWLEFLSHICGRYCLTSLLTLPQTK